MLRRVLVCSTALCAALGVSLGSSATARAEETGSGYVCAGVVITGTVDFGEPVCIPMTDRGTVCANQGTGSPQSLQIVVVACIPNPHPGP